MSPFLSLIVVVPLAFALNWGIYRLLLSPLVRRARSQGHLEAESILATFGLSFILVGVMLAVFGGGYFSYSYLAKPFTIIGGTYGLNRIAAFLMFSKLRQQARKRLILRSSLEIIKGLSRFIAKLFGSLSLGFDGRYDLGIGAGKQSRSLAAQ